MSAGTSSFGMSGVNAHAIFSPAAASDAVRVVPANLLKKQRYWAIPQPYQLVGKVSYGAGICTFQADLRSGDLAYLFEHQVDLKRAP